MRCIHCDTDNTRWDRKKNEGRCKNCQHSFVFEPATMRKFKFDDIFFDRAISDLSDENTLFFTPEQLQYLLDKRLKEKKRSNIDLLGSIGLPLLVYWTFSPEFRLPALLIFSLISGYYSLGLFGMQFTFYNNRISHLKEAILFGIIVIIGSPIFIFKDFRGLTIFRGSLAEILGIALIVLVFVKWRKVNCLSQEFRVSNKLFQTWEKTWVEVNGSIEKMLPSPSAENQQTHLNLDITAYSFDRAIVCDSAEIAQFLIANNFHFENNCAVLSIDGYPQNIFSTVMEMLRRNPDLKVYAIHDASPHGVSLVNQLRTNANWFANSSATIYDLGLSPRQVLKSRSLFIRNSSDSKEQAERLSQNVKQELSQDELEWLEKGNFVELESLMPRRLLQVLTRGIALSQAPDVEGVLIPIESDGGLFFATDSFG